MAENALHPDLMTAAERLEEIGEILAAGLSRLRARESAGSADRPSNAPVQPNLLRDHTPELVARRRSAAAGAAGARRR
jgi:hypothetical protein